jgi:hypothetical protein
LKYYLLCSVFSWKNSGYRASGTVQEEIVAARQLAEHPIAVSLWESGQDDDPGSEADGSSVVQDYSVVDD